MKKSNRQIFDSLKNFRNESKDINGRRFADKYIGPVFWNFPCDTEPNCQSQNASTLAQNYFNLIVGRGGCRSGIILAHDIHDSTVSALTGVSNLSTLGANSPSTGLIARLKNAGCKFVALDAHKNRIEALLGRKPRDGGGTGGGGGGGIQDTGGPGAIVATFQTLLKSKQASGSDLADAEKCDFAISDRMGYSKKESSDNHWKLTVDQADPKCQDKSAFGSGKTVFVFKEHVKIIEPRSCIVAGEFANIRADKNTASEIVGKANQGKEIQVEGLEGEWYPTIHEGKRAFMHNSVFKEPCFL